MFFAVTPDPLLVTAAFHAVLTDCPSGNVHVTVHPVIALPPAVTLTSPWNPPCHWLTIA